MVALLLFACFSSTPEAHAGWGTEEYREADCLLLLKGAYDREDWNLLNVSCFAYPYDEGNPYFASAQGGACEIRGTTLKNENMPGIAGFCYRAGVKYRVPKAP